MRHKTHCAVHHSLAIAISLNISFLRCGCATKYRIYLRMPWDEQNEDTGDV